MKFCANPYCKQSNPQVLSEFCKDKREKDGLYRKCKKCHAMDVKKYYKQNKSILLVKSKKYYKENFHTLKISKAKHQKDNRRAYNAYVKKWATNNKEKAKALIKNWQKTHKAACAAISAKRRAAKLKRTPSWLTKTDIIEIKGFYEKARALSEQTGIPHVVDHIIPLQGRIISGLHVPNNLQILTDKENSIKKNKF
jgi:hypothetical protein